MLNCLQGVDMKRVSLLVVGLLCLSIVAYAGEVITNDTGEPATGLRITFSAPVIIVGFGDILTSVDSQMSASEFVFSGGTVEPWESHWFNYAPTTVSVVKVEWLTGSVALDSPQGDLSRDDLMNLGKAPTYEEIMSAIAEYPGEDEPLYVPDEDEAIWLTDLEGHADIYDNDSIKINYAEWFDASQITKVEIYRNGIKMRFLPNTLDVLTNDQMKTFDGNPLEHTPTSSHTDHAIFGYEYEVAVSGGDEQLLARIPIRIQNPVALSGSYKYANLGHTWWKAVSETWLTDAQVRAYIARVADLGFTGVSFEVSIVSSDNHSGYFFPVYEVGSDRTSEWALTARDSDILDLLHWIEDAGLDAELSLQYWVSDAYKALNPGSLL